MISNPFSQNDMPEPPSLDDETPVSKSPSAGKTSAAEQGLEIPMGWKPTASEPVPVVRCTANASTTGERCKRWSIRGTTVCAKHGGQLPSVIEHSNAVVESARMNLMGMAEDAVDVIRELLQPGTSEQVRLKAAENVLNRTGIKEAIEMKVEVTNAASPSEDILKKLEIMRERVIASQAEEEEELVDEGEYLEEDADDQQNPPIHDPEKT